MWWETVEVILDSIEPSLVALDKAREKLPAEGVEAVVVDAATEPVIEAVEQEFAGRLPVVKVPTDAARIAARCGAEHLIDLGHRSIALLAGPTSLQFTVAQMEVDMRLTSSETPGLVMHVGWTHRAGLSATPNVVRLGVSAVPVAVPRAYHSD